MITARKSTHQEIAVALGAFGVITTDTPPHLRFREARERLGLSQEEVAIQSGFPNAGIWDIETFEGDLTSGYTPRQLQKFCHVLRLHPSELFGKTPVGLPISPEELARRIHEECFLRSLSLAQFEDVVGWRLTACIHPPERLLEDMTIDGLKWLCRELRLDWRRAL